MITLKPTRRARPTPGHDRAVRWAIAALPMAALCVSARMLTPADREEREARARANERLQATVEAIRDRILWWTVRYAGSEGCGGSSAQARAGQITTMVTRFNQFHPGGAAPIALVDGQIYTAWDLSALVTAGYCGEADLVNQAYPDRDWMWDEASRRFRAECPQSPIVGIRK